MWVAGSFVCVISGLLELDDICASAPRVYKWDIYTQPLVLVSICNLINMEDIL